SLYWLEIMGRHRRRDNKQPRRVRVVDMVDVRDLRIHFMTPDAAAQGLHASGRYTALCGADVLPASLTEPRKSAVSRACWRASPINDQGTEFMIIMRYWYLRSARDLLDAHAR
ncbi:MAG: hypothetical protein ACRDS9_13580, partial [Pseudonocardiaceae bacterium]